MSNIIEFNGKRPRIHGSVFVDPTARVMGDVEVLEDSGIWAGAIVRGDDERVSVGRGVVILENCVVEAPRGCPVKIDDFSIISHGAILHGCVVGKNALVGVGAIVLDKARVGDFAIVGAGSLVTPGMVVPRGSLVLGFPAKVVRSVGDEEREMIHRELVRTLEKSQVYKKIFG